MGKKSIVMLMVMAFLGVFVFAGLLMAADAPTEDVAITVEGATKPLVVKFSHAGHKDTACDACHHIYKPDDKGQYPKDKRGGYEKLPANEWKQGAEVQKCDVCHKLEADKKKQKEMQTATDQIRSLEDAFHDNCVACHKDVNKEKKLQGDAKLPQSCNDCHEKS